MKKINSQESASFLKNTGLEDLHPLFFDIILPFKRLFSYGAFVLDPMVSLFIGHERTEKIQRIFEEGSDSGAKGKDLERK